LKEKYKENFNLRYGDVIDEGSISHLISSFEPDEIYNLAAQSDVKISFDSAISTIDINCLGVVRILEAIKNSKKKIKFYQASTSELFGNSEEIPQNENTKMNPQSPYAIAKLGAFYAVRNYRNYGIFCCNGILFNHESPIRGENFVTRKITKGIAAIVTGKQEKIYVGNINAKRDWGYAGDYVKAMWMILQTNIADDYIICSGESHSVREFIEVAFNEVGIKIKWVGSGSNEFGLDSATKKILVQINPEFYRPLEVPYLLGDYSKAKEKLGWVPETSFKELISMMVKSDLGAQK
jgi:GDPmannose 4,6-dehydratase